MNSDETEMVLPFGDGKVPCQLEQCLDVFSGAWMPRILWCLLDGEAHRFTEIEKLIGGVSPKVLAEKLKSLENKQIIQRTVVRSKTPNVEYRLTAQGLAFRSVFRELEAAAERLFPIGQNHS